MSFHPTGARVPRLLEQGCDRRANGKCSYGHMFGDF